MMRGAAADRRIESAAGPIAFSTRSPMRGTSPGGTLVVLGRYEGVTRQMLVHARTAAGDVYAYVDRGAWVVAPSAVRGTLGSVYHYAAVLNPSPGMAAGLGMHYSAAWPEYTWLGRLRAAAYDHELTPAQVEAVARALAMTI